MMGWLRRAGQTHTPVHSESALQQERESGLRLGYQALGVVQVLLQLLLWLTLEAYDRTAQTVWQAAVMLLLPTAALWLVWRGAGPLSLRGGGPSGPPQAGAAPAPGERAAVFVSWLLLPCLIMDCYLLLNGSLSVLTDMIPSFPDWARILIVTLFPLVTAWLSRGKGVAYGAYFMRFYLPTLFLLSTVLVGADVSPVRLWPLLGRGLGQTALTALTGAGACWGVALLYLFPVKQSTLAPRRKTSLADRLLVWLPLALCILWALWMGMVAPWRPGDGLPPGRRMTGISQYSGSVLLSEVGPLFWMSMLPLGLAGTVSGGEQLLRCGLPKLPRFLAGLLVLLPGAAGLWFLPLEPPDLIKALLPWRFVLSALCGAGLWIIRKKGKS